jgi:hypothetical protein
VFEDTNGNGVQDGGETGIPGVLITLDGAITATADLLGRYTLSTTVPGNYTVVETDLPGYFSTTPNEIHLSDVELGQGYQVNFGDAPTSTQAAAIYGIVFEDANRSGLWEAGEAVIPGVIVTLDGITQTTTAPDGRYTLSTTLTGTHIVVETDLPGYSSTTPNEVEVEIAMNEGYRVDFGDVPTLPLPSCDPDSYEEDDIASQAASLRIGSLKIGTRQEHNFCDDATDWNTFIAQAGEVYTITTSSWGPRADTFLTLFDTDGRTFLMANDDSPGTTDYSSRMVWQAPTDGIYYVRTTNRAGLTGSLTDYDLWIEHREKSKIYLPLLVRNYTRLRVVYLPLSARDYGTMFVATSDAVLYPTGIISHTCPDAYEIDDTREQARPIEAGALQVHSFDSEPVYSYAADKDFVWFDIEARQTVTFAITTFTNTLTLLELYDEYGSVLNVTGTTQLTWTASAAGHYYLSISPLTTDTFGCSYEVGYNLLAEVSPIRVIYLPLIVRDAIP